VPSTSAEFDPQQEAALLARARQGTATEQHAAFEEIFRSLRRPLLGLCLNLTGNRSDAEEALQETLVAVYQGLPRFRGESRLGTWVYRVAVRISLRVRAQRRSRMEALTDEPQASTAPDPLVTRERADAVNLALTRLSAEHRTVISLFAIEGLSHGEIAAILGVPEGTVWSRLFAARKKLAAELGRKVD
jgi:RNA polymerase sigma-70 factor, ECF subfamily